MEETIIDIVLTGGPCAGKTTALKHIKDELTDAGWTVIEVPETATRLIPRGINPNLLGEIAYQKIAIPYTMEREAFSKDLADMATGNVLILHDRGLNDQLSYMQPHEKQIIYSLTGIDEAAANARYDAVIHLKSAAYGAEEAYTLDNNEARYESTLDDARAADDRCLNQWRNHPSLHVVENDGSFENKIDAVCKLVKQICDEKINQRTRDVNEETIDLTPIDDGVDRTNQTAPTQMSLPGLG